MGRVSRLVAEVRHWSTIDAGKARVCKRTVWSISYFEYFVHARPRFSRLSLDYYYSDGSLLIISSVQFLILNTRISFAVLLKSFGLSFKTRTPGQLILCSWTLCAFINYCTLNWLGGLIRSKQLNFRRFKCLMQCATTAHIFLHI
jgi:hypothetical protein